jgi:hypothetical protein
MQVPSKVGYEADAQPQQYRDMNGGRDAQSHVQANNEDCPGERRPLNSPGGSAGTVDGLA